MDPEGKESWASQEHDRRIENRNTFRLSSLLNTSHIILHYSCSGSSFLLAGRGSRNWNISSTKVAQQVGRRKEKSTFYYGFFIVRDYIP